MRVFAFLVIPSIVLMCPAGGSAQAQETRDKKGIIVQGGKTQTPANRGIIVQGGSSKRGIIVQGGKTNRGIIVQGGKTNHGIIVQGGRTKKKKKPADT
jgi:hypothetical protein